MLICTVLQLLENGPDYVVRSSFYMCEVRPLRIAKKLFFPNGSNPEGCLDDMEVQLANFNGDLIDQFDESKLINLMNVNPVATLYFSAERYKVATGFTKPRLYLLSKEVSYDSEDDEELLLPVFLEQDTQTVLEQPDTEQPDPLQPNTEQPPPQLKSQLIGTSTERKDFLDQMQRDLAASLQADKAKQEEAKGREEARLSAINKKIVQAEAESKLRENLWLSRLARVPEEPNPNEDHVLVCVRHVSLGPLSRKFSEDATLE